MTKAVLIVDDNDRRRREVYAELSARNVPVLEMKDAFDAMATLGRAEFGAVVLGEDRRRLSLRGLCHLARRRHPSIRLVVLATAPVEAHTVEATLGLSVDVLDADGPPGGIAAQVLTLMARPLDPFVEPPSVDQIDRAIADAFAEAESERRAHAVVDPDEKTQPSARRPERPRRRNAVSATSTSTAPVWEAPSLSSAKVPAQPTPRPSPRPTTEPLLEGVLEAETSTALLMGIFSQELTGRLDITGGAAAGTLYFYRGEPVAADHAEGNAGLLAELEQHDLVPESLEIRFVPEGELLATLVAAGNVTGEAMHRFVGAFIRKRLLELVTQRDGTYRFLEDRRFLESAPLLRVNPFGTMLERRKSTTLPPDLQAQYDDLRDHFVTPRPALRLAAERLRPFVRGARIDEIVGRGVRVHELVAAAGLNDLMGVLFLLTLRDGRLIEVSARPAAGPAPDPVVLGDAPPLGFTPSLDLPELEPLGPAVDDDEGPPSQVAEDDARLREEILSLYIRLKPLSHPRQVLGVPVWADKPAIDAAYQRRLEELDPRRVGEGPSRDMLIARIEELRGKVIRAMEVLQYQQGDRGGAQAPVAKPSVDDSNPF